MPRASQILMITMGLETNPVLCNADSDAHASPVPPARTVGHIPSLDGIRALSFLLVFLSHAGLGDLVPGGFGVTVFFFLSGFLITTLMRVEFESSGAVSLRRFYLRRALRILPPFFVILAAAALVTELLVPRLVTAPALLAQSFDLTNYWIILHGYVGQPFGAGVYWSLAVEEHFYLLFPLLYIAMQRRGLRPSQQARLLWSMCLLVLLWRCVLVFVFHVTSNRTYLGTDTRIDSILFGCALAVWRNPALDILPRSFDERRFRWAILPAAVGALLICLLFRNHEFRQTIRYTIEGMALTFLFTAAIRYSHWPLFRFLNWKPVAFVGVLSYSLYLVHLCVLQSIQHAFPRLSPWPLGAVGLAVSLCIAWAIYELIEKPCARARKRLTVSVDIPAERKAAPLSATR